MKIPIYTIIMQNLSMPCKYPVVWRVLPFYKV